jgi:hypothetical protein
VQQAAEARAALALALLLLLLLLLLARLLQGARAACRPWCSAARSGGWGC